MTATTKIILIILVLAVAAGAGAYWYAFMRPHQNMEKTEPHFELNSAAFLSEYTKDEIVANEKYLGKIIELRGEIVALDRGEILNAIILEDMLFGISAYLDSSFVVENPKITKQIETGQTITIRGQCDGMLTDVVISRAIVVR